MFASPQPSYTHSSRRSSRTSRMRIQLVWSCLMLLLLATAAPTPLSGEAVSSSQLVQPGQVPEGLTAQDWQAIQASIARDQRRFEYEAATRSYRASHAGQRYQVRIAPEGFTVSPRAEAAGWSWGLQLERYGYASALQPVAAVAQTRQAENKLEYERGLEQGFTLLSRPEAGAKEGAALQLVLSQRGNLQAKGESASGIALADAQGNVVLRYAGLVAYDARGKALPVRSGRSWRGLPARDRPVCAASQADRLRWRG